MASEGKTDPRTLMDVGIKKEFLPSAEEVAALHKTLLEGKTDDGGVKQAYSGQKRRDKRDRGFVRHAMLCSNIIRTGECAFGEKCRFLHDVKAYLAAKPADIGPKCHNYEKYGTCKYSFNCRFGDSHLDKETMTCLSKPEAEQVEEEDLGSIPRDVLLQLKRGEYDFKRAPKRQRKGKGKGKKRGRGNKRKAEEALGEGEGEAKAAASAASEAEVEAKTVPTGDDVPLRAVEKKSVDLYKKVYIAPLTTVGNLPFRRVCKGFGADITCGEMALGRSVLQGHTAEAALLQRHPSEDVFGVQVAVAHPDEAARLAEVLDEYCSVDFVDLNMGCPLAGVCNKGMGSALMQRAGRLTGIAKSFTSILHCPFTIKMRVGVSWKNTTAVKMVQRARLNGVAAAGVHGRSARQRYLKVADWDYIGSCVEAANSVLFTDDGEEAPTIPIIGNGDIMQQSDFYDYVSRTGVTTCMIGRGALIKPWLCTEIKEQRVWDIRSSERMDMLKQFTNYGLEHWGSDDKGVNNTRRFMLEWLSFLYRYVPVGLLERPQHINQRPPVYHGRDYLETLMASPHPSDWVKISEMLLGPVPEGFRFVPKHRANSYAQLSRALAASDDTSTPAAQ